MTKTLWLVLLVGLMCGCSTKKCAEISYTHRDGSESKVSKCFEIYTSTLSLRNPTADEQRMGWLRDQSAEGVTGISITEQ